MTLRWAALCLSVAVQLMCRCSFDIAGSGSGTQTTNGICIASCSGMLSGYIFTIDPNDTLQEIATGTFPISIQLLHSDYEPYNNNWFSIKLTPDINGKFSYSPLKPGYYNLIAYDTSNSDGLFLSTIPVSDSTGNFITRKFFSPCGTIQGVIHDMSSSYTGTFTGAYITGTPFFTIADSIGAFSLLRVPLGTYTLRSDYFSKSQALNYSFLRIKGSIPSVIADTLVIYTDSIKVDVHLDSLVLCVELSL